METTILSLDFYNKSYFIQKNDFSYLWHNQDDFLNDTNFPFADNLVRLSYELERNLFVVEKSQGIQDSGNLLPEIIWIQNNFNSMLQIATTREQRERFIITVGIERASRLLDTDWVLQRKQEQDYLNVEPTLTNEKFISVIEYRQALRDITLIYDSNTPANEIIWPVNPID